MSTTIYVLMGDTRNTNPYDLLRSDCRIYLTLKEAMWAQRKRPQMNIMEWRAEPVATIPALGLVRR